VNRDADVTWYYATFPSRLRDASEQIQLHHNAYNWLRLNFGIFIELLRKAQIYLHQQVVDQDDCSAAALELIDRMGTWPHLWVNWTDSEQLLQFAVRLAETRGEYAYQAEFLNRLTGIYVDMARNDLATQTVNQALTICQQHELGLELVKLYGTHINLFLDNRDLGVALSLLAEVENLPDVRRLSPNARHEADGQLLVLRGWIEHQRGALSEAQLSISKAIESLHLAGDISAMAHAYRLAGLIYGADGKPREAINSIKKARYWFKTLGDDLVDSWAVGNMGLIYWRCGQLRQAEKAFEVSIKWARTHHAYRQEVYETGHRCIVAISQGRLAGADRLLRTHKQLAEQHHIEDEIWRATANLGIACFHREHYQEALSLMEAENDYNDNNRSSDGDESKRILISHAVMRQLAICPPV